MKLSNDERSKLIKNERFAKFSEFSKSYFVERFSDSVVLNRLVKQQEKIRKNAKARQQDHVGNTLVPSQMS